MEITVVIVEVVSFCVIPGAAEESLKYDNRLALRDPSTPRMHSSVGMTH